MAYDGPSLGGVDQVYPRTDDEIIDSIINNCDTNPKSATLDFSLLLRDSGEKMPTILNDMITKARDKGKEGAVNIFISANYYKAIELIQRSRDSRKKDQTL